MKKIIFSFFLMCLFTYAYPDSYSISGEDELGNEVTGEIESSYGRNVEGTITDPYGNEREVTDEWDGNGHAFLEDDNGNSYDVDTD